MGSLLLTKTPKVKLQLYFFKYLPSSSVCAIKRFAEDPEFTNMDALTPKKDETFAQILL